MSKPADETLVYELSELRPQEEESTHQRHMIPMVGASASLLGRAIGTVESWPELEVTLDLNAGVIDAGLRLFLPHDAPMAKVSIGYLLNEIEVERIVLTEERASTSALRVLSGRGAVAGSSIGNPTFALHVSA